MSKWTDAARTKDIDGRYREAMEKALRYKPARNDIADGTEINMFIIHVCEGLA